MSQNKLKKNNTTGVCYRNGNYRLLTELFFNTKYFFTKNRT